MAAQITENLSCPICYDYLKDPKQLVCGHTFCERCLVRVCAAEARQNLTCPICRRVTPVPDRGVTELPTNITLRNLVEDLKSVTDIAFCSANCNAGDRSPAIKYCQTCEAYMCHSCLDMHGQWKRMAEHDVASVEDIKSGRVTVKQKCKKHPNEGLMYTCMTCMKFVCFRCRTLECDKRDHKVIEAAEYTKKKQNQIKQLEGEVKRHLNAVSKAKDHAEQLMPEIKAKVTECRADVINSYDEAMARLVERREALLRICDQEERVNLQRLERLKEDFQQVITRVSNALELVKNGKKAVGKGTLLEVHETLCSRLEDIMDRPDSPQPRREDAQNIVDCAKRLKFKKDDTPIDLGEMVSDGWCLKGEVDISEYGSMFDMAATPDGMMAVVTSGVGVKIFSSDGHLKRTVLEDVAVRSMAFTSNGCCLVRDVESGITQYDRDWDELDVSFELEDDEELQEIEDMDDEHQENENMHNNEPQMDENSDDDDLQHNENSDDDDLQDNENSDNDDLQHNENTDDPKHRENKIMEDGNISVNKENIYINYTSARKIKVLNSVDGKLQREIMCQYEPTEIFAMKSKGMIVVTTGNAVHLIDGTGKQLKRYTDCAFDMSPAIRKDDSILIARVERDYDESDTRLYIDQFTSGLERQSNLIVSRDLISRDLVYRTGFYLQESTSGDIAFCTQATLFIFHKEEKVLCVQ